MRRAITIFLLAIGVPSLVLAWLALRSLRDQELIFERQQELLYQGLTDATAERIRSVMQEKLGEFESVVDALVSQSSPAQIAPGFNEKLRASWPLAEVGFAVTLEGSILAPRENRSKDADDFRQENAGFLANTVSAEVYQNQKQQVDLPDLALQKSASMRERTKPDETQGSSVSKLFRSKTAPAQSRDALPKEEQKANAKPMAGAERDQETRGEKKPAEAALNDAVVQAAAPAPAPATSAPQPQSAPAYKGKQGTRNLTPQKLAEPADGQSVASSIQPAEADFRSVVGEASSGSVARFLNDKLRLMLWHRTTRDPLIVFGAQINLAELAQLLASTLSAGRGVNGDICLALINDKGTPAALTHADFKTDWRRPLVATEIGEQLPHWEVAVYLIDPHVVSTAAHGLRRTMFTIVGLLIIVIGFGGWLIVSEARRQMLVARQKTDFVSNVSHELKTPLTSIRMFSEMLAEGRVEEPEKQREFSRLIALESSRLTRLIHNVLSFARMERGEQRMEMQPGDLTDLVEEVVAAYRPQMESTGHQLIAPIEATSLPVLFDRDAIKQVILNLLSNAEKYGGDARQITILLRESGGIAECTVADRGPGVPRESEERIFQQFYRADDALSSGIQGAGLGLTLARQIARAHGGDLVFSRREGGGSMFTLRIPLAS